MVAVTGEGKKSAAKGDDHREKSIFNLFSGSVQQKSMEMSPLSKSSKNRGDPLLVTRRWPFAPSPPLPYYNSPIPYFFNTILHTPLPLFLFHSPTLQLWPPSQWQNPPPHPLPFSLGSPIFLALLPSKPSVCNLLLTLII